MRYDMAHDSIGEVPDALRPVWKYVAESATWIVVRLMELRPGDRFKLGRAHEVYRDGASLCTKVWEAATTPVLLESGRWEIQARGVESP